MRPVPAGACGAIAHRISRSITFYASKAPQKEVMLVPTAPIPSPPRVSPTSSPTSLSSHFPSPSDRLLPSALLPPCSPAPPAPLDAGPRPLLLLLPWLGARPGALAKYLELYLRWGLEVLVVESDVSQFLWPRWGLEFGAEVLEVLQSERFAQRPLLVHAFSIGGFTFAQLMVHMARDPQRYGDVNGRVKGQIYDSLVHGTLEHMATGLGKVLLPSFDSLLRYTSLLYFWLFKQQTVVYYTAAIDVFRDSPVTAPALYFFCENDDMCDPVAMDELVAHWRKSGITVEKRKWEESVHAAHLRCHPEEYLSTLGGFLDSLDIGNFRAKM